MSKRSNMKNVWKSKGITLFFHEYQNVINSIINININKLNKSSDINNNEACRDKINVYVYVLVCVFFYVCLCLYACLFVSACAGASLCIYDSTGAVLQISILTLDSVFFLFLFLSWFLFDFDFWQSTEKTRENYQIRSISELRNPVI